MRKYSILFVSAAILVVGCGTSEPAGVEPPATGAAPAAPPQPAPDDAGGPGTADAGIVPPAEVGPAIDAFDAALAAAVCQKVAACCSTADRDAFLQQFKTAPYDLTVTPTPAECSATLATQLGKLHKKWAASAALGRITFSATRSQACVAGVAGAACGAPLTTALFDSACFGTRGNEVFTKVTPLGAACKDIKDGTFFGECNPKLGYCNSTGTCEAWRKTGEDCGVIPTRMFCGPDLSCEGGSPSKPGKCSAAPIKRQIGESCDATSGPLELCPAGAYCDGDTGMCATTKADGAACKFDDECTTFRAYSCSPFGAGTCGSDTFCKSATGGM
ncbi:MAG TPA: hypothetical protein VLT33_48960 [Labilithrix sp.]|nr:hypothetical protein [Labilithrix sp.]